jgi:hypothetical protein
MVAAALVVAVVSALGTVGAVVYARRLDGRARDAVDAARASAAAAERSAAASESRLAVEAARRHAELTPRFRVSVERPNPDMRDWRLTVFLAGPPELGRLDSLTVRIRDDHHWRAEGSRLAGGPSLEEVRAQVWGGYRFVPGTGPGADAVRGVPGADPTGRVTPTGGMPVGESLVFALEPTNPPRWSEWSGKDWRQQVGDVLRLQLEAQREGHDPWVLVCEVPSDGKLTVDVP